MINPFNPGAGRMPPYLAGRNEIFKPLQRDMDAMYERGDSSRPVIVSGLRGMGKTVSLRALANDPARSDWVVIWVEASRNEDLPKRISRSLFDELRKRSSAKQALSHGMKRALSVFKSFQLKFDPAGTYTFGIEVDPDKAYASSGDLALDLSDLLQAIGEAARDDGTAVLVAIDELQEAAEDDLRALNMALHALGQQVDPVPVFFVGAGLPTLPSVLANASSYAERMYRYYELGDLDVTATEKALIEPTSESGWEWSNEALDAVVDVSRGYPFFIQQCGYSICERMGMPRRIEGEAVHQGIQDAIGEMDRGIYNSRWNRATPRGRDLMAAMAEDEGLSSMTDLTRRMHKRKPSDLSVIRDTLIKNGLIYSPERGYLAFTVPGMAEYIRRNAI